VSRRGGVIAPITGLATATRQFGGEWRLCSLGPDWPERDAGTAPRARGSISGVAVTTLVGGEFGGAW